MSVALRPCYSGGPIGSMRALAAVTVIPAVEIAALARDVANNYRPVKLIKDDGSFRECWDPSTRLRQVQRRLIVELLRKVKYPPYLHGSLPKRDYLTNAAAHIRSRWCVCMDIKSFFPSISAELILAAVWRGFFGCPEEIAELLTQLTTLDGKLPQGSLTASYLANLVLWRHEPRLVSRLHAHGMRYTRYVDDISISSPTYPAPQAKTYAIGQTNTMLRLNGLVQKRSKIQIATSGSGIEIMGLTVGRNVGRSKRDRNALARSVIDHAGVAAAISPKEAKKLADSLRGKIAELGRHHPREAEHLRGLLDSESAW